jgi:hypothetical protein
MSAVEPTETIPYWGNTVPVEIGAATANEPAKQIVTNTVRLVSVARAARGKRFGNDFIEIPPED